MAQPSTSISFGDSNRGFQAGVIHGDVHHHNPSAERPRTPPTPSCTIPFRRDPDFVDRGTLLEEIRDKCAVPASRVALVGLGGVGKSQLVIEYCYRTADTSPKTWIFWVHASNAARLQQGYREIADQINLAGRADPKADILVLLRNWLRNEKNGKWLIVLDNVDNISALSLPSSNGQSGHDAINTSNFTSFLPQSRNGSVLITSRNKNVALQLVDDSDIVPVEPMDDTGASALLHRKLGDVAETGDISKLSEALEYMPLALVQAASYIRQRASRCSVQQYLETFQKSDRKKMSLLQHDGGRLRRDTEAKNSILITWQISFDHLRHERPSAADLLSLMSFFDRQGIPEALIRRNQRSENTDADENDDRRDGEEPDDSEDENDTDSTDDGLEDDILMLRDYSFIRTTIDATIFEMHRLVQLAMQKWLEEQDQLEKWKEEYIYKLDAAFPLGEFQNWARCQALFPHAKSALSQRPKSEKSLLIWAHLLYNAGSYAYEKYDFRTAEFLLVKSTNVNESLLGREHERTSRCLNVLALTLTISGRAKEALELNLETLEARMRLFGEEHEGTLVAMHNLAFSYGFLGDWQKAKNLFAKVLEIQKRKLGEEHQSTLSTMRNLAQACWNLREYQEAKKLAEGAVDLGKNLLGEEHPHTLRSINTLVLVYMETGLHKKAEELVLQATEISKRVLGGEDNLTVSFVQARAEIYSLQGRFQEDEELCRRVLEIRRRNWGERHPETLTDMYHLAWSLKRQSRLIEAISLMEKCVELRKEVIGLEHPVTQGSLEDLLVWKLEEDESEIGGLNDLHLDSDPWSEGSEAE